MSHRRASRARAATTPSWVLIVLLGACDGSTADPPDTGAPPSIDASSPTGLDAPAARPDVTDRADSRLATDSGSAPDVTESLDAADVDGHADAGATDPREAGLPEAESDGGPDGGPPCVVPLTIEPGQLFCTGVASADEGDVVAVAFLPDGVDPEDAILTEAMPYEGFYWTAAPIIVADTGAYVGGITVTLSAPLGDETLATRTLRAAAPHPEIPAGALVLENLAAARTVLADLGAGPEELGAIDAAIELTTLAQLAAVDLGTIDGTPVELRPADLAMIDAALAAAAHSGVQPPPFLGCRSTRADTIICGAVVVAAIGGSVAIAGAAAIVAIGSAVITIMQTEAELRALGEPSPTGRWLAQRRRRLGRLASGFLGGLAAGAGAVRRLLCRVASCTSDPCAACTDLEECAEGPLFQRCDLPTSWQCVPAGSFCFVCASGVPFRHPAGTTCCADGVRCGGPSTCPAGETCTVVAPGACECR